LCSEVDGDPKYYTFLESLAQDGVDSSVGICIFGARFEIFGFEDSVVFSNSFSGAHKNFTDEENLTECLELRGLSKDAKNSGKKSILAEIQKMAKMLIA
jgi:hypothetical protein